MISRIVSRTFSITSLALPFEENVFARLARIQAREKRLESFGLPWNFSGVIPQEAGLRYVADRMILQNEVDLPRLMVDVYKNFYKILECLVSKDLSEVDDLLHPKLQSKFSAYFDQLERENHHVVLLDSPKYKNSKPTVNVVDAIVYRGLYIDREKNDPVDKYHVYADPMMGLVAFTHNALQDHLAYTNQDGIEDLHTRNRQTVLQLLVNIESKHMLHLYKGDECLTEYDEEYTWTQQIILESQCVQPEWMKNENKTEGYLEWMSKFSPESWVFTDVNEWLDTNPLVKGLQWE